MKKENKYNYALGRRKKATATVKLYPGGKGHYSIVGEEGKSTELKVYFGGNKFLANNSLHCFSIIGDNLLNKFDADIVIRGGGISGQAEAIRLAFARALIEYNPEYKLMLKPYGLLKRDARAKERKKPGLKGARRSPQWSKR